MNYAIGLDLGGTNIKGLAVTTLGRVLAEENRPTRDDGTPGWKRNVQRVLSSLQETLRHEPDFVGLAAPGLAARDHRSIAFMPQRLRGLEGLDWQRYFSFARAVPVLNDAQAALLGEVDGVRLISPQRLREVSAVAMSGADQLFGFPTSWGLGYSIEQSTTNAHETLTVFGVGGVGGSYAYADRPSGVTFALTKNRLTPSFETAQQVSEIVKKAIAES